MTLQVLCMDLKIIICPFGHCIIFTSSIYDFWLPLFGIFTLFLLRTSGSLLRYLFMNTSVNSNICNRIFTKLMPSRLRLGINYASMKYFLITLIDVIFNMKQLQMQISWLILICLCTSNSLIRCHVHFSLALFFF